MPPMAKTKDRAKEASLCHRQDVVRQYVQARDLHHHLSLGTWALAALAN